MIKLPPDYTLHSFDTIDGTNAEAKRMAAGASGNAVLVAKAQTAGRGRYDRAWVSDAGNLFATLLLFPELPAERLPELSFVMALAARDAIGPQVQLKWPNDMLLNGRKTGGILLESGVAGGKMFVAAGIGINVVSHPEKTMYPATNLGVEGIEIPSDKLLEKLVNAFDLWYREWHGGFAPVHSAWLKAARGVGEAIEIRLQDKTLQGVFRGLTPEGALELELPDGKIQRVTAGDVFMLGKN